MQTIEGFDLESTLRRFNNNEAFMWRILRQFSDQYADFYDRIKALSAEERRVEAHTFAGAAANLGAVDLARAAKTLELACQEDDGDQALVAFEQVFVHSMSQLSNYFENAA